MKLLAKLLRTVRKYYQRLRYTKTLRGPKPLTLTELEALAELFNQTKSKP
jgi:hypothetical protein